ncbi:hypothetical protein [Fluviispira sanaruensis]|uniref:Haem-binding uptake Tiki superfamily ChaN domain-containing protein n=1 Tax=Fluviispira sanaruensis TaxID=2493639 RepID=A0A4V0P2F9_FLUSA|nr:hypothetical protein [Fluviispira sanaruensis]BBH53087.1 hypothetical protein JCM31447_15300 [Fluviispira sanaruensis]
MLKFPRGMATPNLPIGVFIGDEHSDPIHLIQLTASISELVSNGIQVLFIEAFYVNNPPLQTDIVSLGNYIRGRNFDHTKSSKIDLPNFYDNLLKRCNIANLHVRGVDVPLPSEIANLQKGKAFKVIAWRTGRANDDWKRNIEDYCKNNNWSKFALFGGRAHAKPLFNRFGGRISPQIWSRPLKKYIDL